LGGFWRGRWSFTLGNKLRDNLDGSSDRVEVCRKLVTLAGELSELGFEMGFGDHVIIQL
jgi:hypothetical protein